MNILAWCMAVLDFKKAFTTAKHSILIKNDLDKFAIAKLIHQLVNNELPPQYSSFFYSHKSDTLANNEARISGTWFVHSET